MRSGSGRQTLLSLALLKDDVCLSSRDSFALLPALLDALDEPLPPFPALLLPPLEDAEALLELEFPLPAPALLLLLLLE